MKIYVYAISSTTRSYIYVGMSDNLRRRLEQHNAGKNRTTKPYLPFVLIWVEEFPSRSEARKREKYLKSGVGKEFLKACKPISLD
ncbi:MAG: GIY-YIG nuclease family protein [Bacteroidota bacterium]